jgi:hypothetical protein
MKRFVSISVCSIFLLVLFTSQVGAATRHCDANYVWETTGGSIQGSFGAFKGKGECGKNVPNRCRIRARNAIERCAQVHWEKRWDREIPEACIQNNSDSTVVGYNLALKCSYYPGRENEGCWVDPLDNSLPTLPRTISSSGDIKQRLEGEVCCVYKNGNHQYKDNSNVEVRLSFRSRGDNHCGGGGQLSSSSYKIDCKQFREQYCPQGNR